VALAVFPLVSNDLYYQVMLILTFLLAIGATGWNIMGGYAGYISLGNSLFVGLGAYTTGILAAKQNVPPFLGCLAGGLVCALAAAVLSLVTRRTRGMYFTIVTFAALQLLAIVATIWSGLTGGSQGLALPLPAWSLSYEDWPFYYSLLGLLVLSVAVSAGVRRSKLGLGLFAIQDDEGKAAGLGLAVSVYKLIAFVLGGTFFGVAGGIYAYNVTFLNVSAVFDIVTSMLIVLAALLGGRGTLWGPVLGAFIIEPLANLTSTSLGGADAGAIRLLLFGGLLGGVVLFLPRGVLPTWHAWRRKDHDHPERTVVPPAADVSPAAPAAEGAGDTSRGSRGGAVLTVRGLAKAFGGVRAVDGVDLDVASASVTGLMGPNGSGKTTLFNLIDGTVRASGGRITLAGRRVERSGRPARSHGGLARTYQLPRLFPSLTVLENVVLAERRLALSRLFLPRVTAAERPRALAVLAGLGLSGYADASPAMLSYGQRKLIELAQVLWLDPALVLLDEPAAGMTGNEVERLITVIRRINQTASVIVVDHDMGFVRMLGSTVTVFHQGSVLVEGPADKVLNDPMVREVYIGNRAA